MENQSKSFNSHCEKLFPLGFVIGIVLGKMIGSVGIGVVVALVAIFLSALVVKRFVLA